MSRVRFMSPYLKGGRDTAKLTNRARYIATRPGVEVLRGEHSGQPATKKQQAYIQRLLRDFVGGRPALATTSLYPRTKIERPKPGRNWPQRGSFLAGRGPGPPSA